MGLAVKVKVHEMYNLFIFRKIIHIFILGENNGNGQNDAQRDGQDGRKEKKRGRNKNRPPPLKFSRGQRLCPILIDVSPEREALPKCKFEVKPKFDIFCITHFLLFLLELSIST